MGSANKTLWEEKVMAYVDKQQSRDGPQTEAPPRIGDAPIHEPAPSPAPAPQPQPTPRPTPPVVKFDITRHIKPGLVDIDDYKSPGIVIDTFPQTNIEPTPDLEEPVHAGRFLLWPDPDNNRAFYTLTEPELVDFSLTVQREEVGDTIETTGGTVAMTVSAYTQAGERQMARHRREWSRELERDGYGRRKWRFQPLNLRNLRGELELPAAQRRGRPDVTVNVDAGLVTFLMELTDVGAVAWRGALKQGRADVLTGVCRLTAKYYAQIKGEQVTVREQRLNATLGRLLSNVDASAIHSINPEVSLEAKILISPHSLVERVTVDMQPSDGGEPQHMTCGEEGGQLALRITTDDIDSVSIDWQVEIVYKPADWPIKRESGTLSSGDWTKAINPASDERIRRHTFMAMLLDGAGDVLPAGSDADVDVNNRVFGDVSFNAPYLDAPIQHAFETSSQQVLEFAVPQGDNGAQGTLKLSIVAVRGGDQEMQTRRLQLDESLSVARVYPDAHISIETNADPMAEASDSAQMLDVLAEMQPESARRPEALGPWIWGPESLAANAGPPLFEVFPRRNPFYVVEVATRAELFDIANHSGEHNRDNFYASDWDSPRFLSGPVYELPARVWDRLKDANRLYYRVLTSASDQEWRDWEASTPDYVYMDAPYIQIARAPAGPNADLQDALNYLGINYNTFSPWEPDYFARLKELLIAAGTLNEGDRLDQATFHAALETFQRARGLGVDGIPGENTLWALQQAWAERRNLRIVEEDADVWLRPGVSEDDYDPGQHGYGHFNLREDAARRYRQLRREVEARGAIITSGGSFRRLNAAVGAGRSTTSFHYAGLAFDLALPTGMRDPEVDPFIITRDGDRWRVWARADDGVEQDLDAVVYQGGRTHTRRVRATVIDFTRLAAEQGFERIGPRNCFPADYTCAEWWHFQCEAVLTPWISQFGIELLSLDRYTPADLRNVNRIWNPRKRIFQREPVRRGWH